MRPAVTRVTGNTSLLESVGIRSYKVSKSGVTAVTGVTPKDKYIKNESNTAVSAGNTSKNGGVTGVTKRSPQ